VRRVLLLRPDHIGDVLLTAQAVALLRASLRSAKLTYAVGHGVARPPSTAQRLTRCEWCRFQASHASRLLYWRRTPY